MGVPDGSGKRIRTKWHADEMHVVRHERIGPYQQVESLRVCVKQPEVEPSIMGAEEHRSVTVATL